MKRADLPESSKALLLGIEAMIPNLRARAADAERARRIPDATIAELDALGAFRAVVPRSYGGLEVPFPVVPQLFRMMSRGCMSTGWTMGFLIYHNFQFAHFSKAAQDATWGVNGQTMAPGQVMPSGNARRVEGGYRISGRWGYATGILHGDYMLFSSPVDNTEPPEVRRFFAAVSDFTRLDTWNVTAMRATGSHDVTVEDLFVPEDHSILVSDLREGRAPGLTLHDGPLWRVPLLSFMSLGCVGMMIGGTEALFELVSEGLARKVGAYSGDRQAGLMTQRVRMARLSAELGATVTFFEAAVDQIWEAVQSGETISREARARYRMIVAHTAAKCHLIADELAHAGGSRANYSDSPIGRFHRDISTMATHALFEYDHIANMHGGVLLGQELPENAML